MSSQPLPVSFTARSVAQMHVPHGKSGGIHARCWQGVILQPYPALCLLLCCDSRLSRWSDHQFWVVTRLGQIEDCRDPMSHLRCSENLLQFN